MTISQEIVGAPSTTKLSTILQVSKSAATAVRMNTIRSTWYGWGTLVVAGAGAYIFAKRSVNADRKARHEEDEKRRRRVQSLEHGAIAASQQQQQQQEGPQKKKQQRRTGADNKQEDDDDAGNNKGLGSGSLPPEPNGGQQTTTTVGVKSKYEPTEPFRAKKGDRFS